MELKFEMTEKARTTVLKQLASALGRQPTKAEIKVAESKYLDDFARKVKEELRKAGLQ